MKKNQKIIITKSGIELKQTEDIKSHELYKENKTKAILEIYNHINNNNNEQITFIKEIIEYYYTQLSQCLDNTIIDIKFDQEIKNNIINNTPFIKGEEYVNEHWLDKITTTFNEYINELHIKNIETYLKDQQYNYQKKGRIFFHLVESKKEDLPFAFLATYSKIIDCKTKHMPLKSALTIYKEDNRELLNILTCVKKVSVQSDFIKQLLNDGSIYKPFFLNKIDAYTFLKEVPLYEQSGITCRIPNFFKKKNKSIKTSLKIETSPSYLNLNNLLNVEVILKIDDLTLTKKEVTEILNQTGLAFIKGKWIEIDKKKLKEVLIKYEKLEEIYNDKQITMKEALLLNAKTDINITNGEKFNEILENIIKKTNFEQIIMPSTFKANLRPYQQIGVNYLTYMQKLGLGVCLADDMGLGKTIQILGFLATQNNHNITLIVMPSSLIGNWEKEIKTFIPSKKVLILHNNYAKPDKQQIKNNDIIITSYGMVTKLDFLKEIKFDILILDEAQAIKNANAIKSISINNLKANYKIALTGTPIENSLSDLWSIFNFLNP
ncbi:MAG: SNF2-related protein [Bacilli bacterium]